MVNGNLKTPYGTKKIKFNIIKNFKKSIFDQNLFLDEVIPYFKKKEKKLLLIKNNRDTIIGVITLGDIVKSLLKYRTIKLKLEIVCNKKFLYLKNFDHKSNKDKVLRKFYIKDINYIPVFKKKKIIKIIELKKNSEYKKIPVVIMAGGKGTRLMPLTKNLPKPMLNIRNKPMIHHLINKIKKYQFKNFYISVNYLKDKIISYFENNKIGSNIKFLIENKYLGTAGILHILKSSNYQNILVVNCDISTDLNYDNLVKFHFEKKSDFTIVSKHLISKSEYGTIKSKNKKVEEIVEKEETEVFVNCGIYLINTKCLKYLKKDFMDMNSLINILIKKKYKVKEYPIFDRWTDLGTRKRLGC